jgi:CheY-like chemotaxis protein
MEPTSSPQLAQSDAGSALTRAQPVRGHVLVVDDDPGIRGFLQAILESEGFGVAAAADGQAALEQIAARRPDVVLLDLAMPVLDGWQVQARLRAEGLAIPLIFMSAGYDAALEARRHGAAGHLIKPFDADVMLALVCRLAGVPQR